MLVVVVLAVQVVAVAVVWGSYALLTNVILDYERGCMRLGPAVWGDEKIRVTSRNFAELQNRRTRYRVVGLLETTFSQFTIKLRDKIGAKFSSPSSPIFFVFLRLFCIFHNKSAKRRFLRLSSVSPGLESESLKFDPQKSMCSSFLRFTENVEIEHQ